jgi:Tetratricopeptide repeat
MGDHLHQAEVLARTLGDQHRLARIAVFMVNQCINTGDYDEAVRFGQEALSIARTLNDRSIEVVATNNLGQTHAARGEFSEAAALLEVKSPGGAGGPFYLPRSVSSASAFSSQYVMPISRYIVVAVVRCSWACSRLAVRW